VTIFYCLTALGAFRLFREYREREREESEKESGEVVRNITFGDWAQENISPVLKVRRQCPWEPRLLTLLVTGTALSFLLPQRKNNFTATKTNRLMQFRGTISAY
jgi:hypothetical protein